MAQRGVFWSRWRSIREMLPSAGLKPGYVRRINTLGWDIWGIKKSRRNILQGIRNYKDEWKSKEPYTLIAKAAKRAGIGNVNRKMNKKISQLIMESIFEESGSISRYLSDVIREKKRLVIYDVGFGRGDTSIELLSALREAIAGDFFDLGRLDILLYLIDIDGGTLINGEKKISERFGDYFVKLRIENKKWDMHDMGLALKNVYLPDIIIANASLHHTPIYSKVVENLFSLANENSRIYGIPSFIGVGEWTHGLWLIPELTLRFAELAVDVGKAHMTPGRAMVEFNEYIGELENNAELLDRLRENYLDDLLMSQLDIRAMRAIARFWFEVAAIYGKMGRTAPMWFLEGHIPKAKFFGILMSNMKPTDVINSEPIDPSTNLNSVASITIMP